MRSSKYEYYFQKWRNYCNLDNYPTLVYYSMVMALGHFQLVLSFEQNIMIVNCVWTVYTSDILQDLET